MAKSDAQRALLGDLRDRFVLEARQHIGVLKAWLQDGLYQPETQEILHKWIGSASLLGVGELGHIAHELHKQLVAGSEANRLEVRRLIAEAEQILGTAGGEIGDAAVERTRESGDFWGRKIALVGFESSGLDWLRSSLEKAGALCRWMEALHRPNPEELKVFDLLIVKHSPIVRRYGWAWAIADASVASLWIGDSLQSFEETQGLFARVDFLLEPVRAEELMIRAKRLLSADDAPATNSAVDPSCEVTRVLVADDDTTVTTLLEGVLLQEGWLCHVANDGRAALETARRVTPDAIVLDIMMPEKDGFEVLSMLRSHPATAEIPVAILSVRQQEADIVRAFGLGADDYITKPFSPMEVVVRLRRLLHDRKPNALAGESWQPGAAAPAELPVTPTLDAHH